MNIYATLKNQENILMNKSFALYILILITFLFSQKGNYTVTENNGLKTFVNKNTPSNINFNVGLRKIRTINFKNDLNIPTKSLHLPLFYYNEENQLMLIFSRYDKGDRILTSLNCETNDKKEKRIRRGYGPEEIFYGAYSYANDSLIYYANRDKTLIFDRGLNYVTEFNHGERYGITNSIHNVYGIFDNNLLVLSKNTEFTGQSEGDFISSVQLLDHENFKIIKNLYETKEKFNKRNFEKNLSHHLMFDIITATFSEDEIYVSEMSPDKYRITCFDKEGNEKYSMVKSFRRLRYTKSETDFNNNVFRKNIYTGGQGESSMRWVRKNKNIISSLNIDKDGYLFVEVSEEERNIKENIQYFDVFKDGIFKNRVELELNVCDSAKVFNHPNLYFISDKLINVGFDKNSHILIDIYDYEIIE